jgi:Lrp/AsnC family leucine-responsive transcriptional regulator
VAPAPRASRSIALKLDRRDRRILEELQRDNTITYRALSERVALSPSACVLRVQQMEKAGIIRGYHADIAIEKVQPVVFMVAEIALASHNPDALRAFDKLLLETPEVIEVLRVNGPFDYVVRFMLPSVQDWHPFAVRLLDPVHKVEKMITHVVMQEVKPFVGYPIQ